jgi:hypothetical protein
MSCCGQKRQQVAITGTAPAAPHARVSVLFEYTGRTSLAVIGPATRTSYRFSRPGARVLVDGRDRASLATIPALRQIAAAR